MARRPRNAQGRIRPETVWRLVEAQCAQLSDAVSNARIPFLLGMTWAFVWAWALYSVDLGYINLQYARAKNVYVWMLSDHPQDQAKFLKACDRWTSGVPDLKASAKKKKAICVEIAKGNFQKLESAYLDAQQVTFPGGFGKLSISDLGIVGQFGLFLVLSWSFFAARRENHAIRAIVDMDDDSRRLDRWSPQSYTLEVKAPYLSAEHVAHAYYSVAQRFIFLFSHHSRPLVIYTVLLSIVPALVASWNTYTDVRDVIGIITTVQDLPQTPMLLVKVLAGLVLLVILWVITLRIIRLEIDTSVLLNGWYLAARDVWTKKWDESNQDQAPPVFVDAAAQSAKQLVKRPSGKATLASFG